MVLGFAWNADFSGGVECYRLASEHGHPDGANNFGFCPGHGRRVQQNLEIAAEHYKFAAERGHLEANLNRARFLRLLGRWKPPDRSSETVSPFGRPIICLNSFALCSKIQSSWTAMASGCSVRRSD
jgi:TPR repeat protein